MEVRTEWLLIYNSIGCFDTEGIYVPHRDVGRPRRKWDDDLKAFFIHHCPDYRGEHWSHILQNESILEEHFVSYCMSVNDLTDNS